MCKNFSCWNCFTKTYQEQRVRAITSCSHKISIAAVSGQKLVWIFWPNGVEWRGTNLLFFFSRPPLLTPTSSLRCLRFPPTISWTQSKTNLSCAAAPTHWLASLLVECLPHLWMKRPLLLHLQLLVVDVRVGLNASVRLLLSALWRIFCNSAWYTGLIFAQIVTHTPLGALSLSLCSVLIPLMLKSPLHFCRHNSFCQGFLQSKLNQNRSVVIPLLHFSLIPAACFFFSSTLSFFTLSHCGVSIPAAHLADPLRCRGPGHPWSTGRCRCSWRPRRTAPPVLPAPLTGPRAPGRSECTTLQQRERKKLWPCDLLLECNELLGLCQASWTSACPYSGCWCDLSSDLTVCGRFFIVLMCLLHV